MFTTPFPLYSGIGVYFPDLWSSLNHTVELIPGGQDPHTSSNAVWEGGLQGVTASQAFPMRINTEICHAKVDRGHMPCHSAMNILRMHAWSTKKYNKR